MSELIEIALQITGDGKELNSQILFEKTQYLRKELHDLRLGALEITDAKKPPEGSMSSTAFTLGALVIAVLPQVLPSLIEFLKEWRLRNTSLSLTIKSTVGDNTIEITVPDSMTKEEVDGYIHLLNSHLNDSQKQ